MKIFAKSHPILKRFSTSILLFVAGFAHADGITDLKAALKNFQASGDVKAVMDVNTLRKQGEDEGVVETNGQIQVNLQDGASGFQIAFSKGVLHQLEQEARQRIKDKESPSPTRQASAEISMQESQLMLSAANALRRQIEEYSFRGETNESYNGQPARLLTFAFGLERLPAIATKYIENFEHRLDIWINKDGIPLASRVSEIGSGSAFIVLSFKQVRKEYNVYQVQGDRLLIIHRESKTKTSGAGESADTQVTKTLQVQSS